MLAHQHAQHCCSSKQLEFEFEESSSSEQGDNETACLPGFEMQDDAVGNPADARTQIAFNLMSGDDRARPTIMFIVYETIKQNEKITLNQLRWLMTAEFLVPENTVDAAVASLASASLFRVISKWWSPDKPEVIWLRARPASEMDISFLRWIASLYNEFPELMSFKAPIFKKRNAPKQEFQSKKHFRNKFGKRN